MDLESDSFLKDFEIKYRNLFKTLDQSNATNKDELQYIIGDIIYDCTNYIYELAHSYSYYINNYNEVIRKLYKEIDGLKNENTFLNRFIEENKKFNC